MKDWTPDDLRDIRREMDLDDDHEENEEDEE